MKTNRSTATRVALLAATSFSALAIATPSAAQVATQEYNRTIAAEALHDLVASATLNSGAVGGFGFDAVGIENIVANHTVTPGPGSAATGANYANSTQVLDAAGVNGVGQQIAFIQSSPTAAGLSLCTGSLINPRTVITAAHCVSSRPAHMYGSVTGTGGGVNGPFGAAGATVTSTGVPISFGFSSTNRCLGVTSNGCAVGEGAYEAWRNSGFQSQAGKHIYNGNQVWYLTQSQAVNLGGGGEFAHGDIALVTLDTHVQDVPTWTLLFSPLTGPTHATITGYGGAGVGLSGIGSLAGIDYRRRSAENMIDALMSWHDQNTTGAISGPTSTARIIHQHPIYWLDFDDPNWTAEAAAANPNFFTNTAPAGGRNNGYYDFNGLGGITLPNEGATAGGDSGGPLVVDQRWSKKVIAGVLTGSISYNGGLSTYGQFNVYPPLFQFWQDIVANNPYVYASAKAGDGNWHDAAHWIQDMDPNYAIIGANGELLTGVPDTTQGGGDDPSYKFGTVYYLGEDCFDADGNGPGTAENCGTVTGTGPRTGNGSYVYTPGGPGTTNFVPNNIEPVNSANAALHKKARYFDVTLRQAGKTTLTGSATIDKLTIEGPARLNIAGGASLNVWGDYNQAGGLLNIDGLLKTSEALVATGLLSGTGVFNPTFLTVVAGAIGPAGGDKVGTFTVQADTILGSAASLFIDAQRGKADKLVIIGDGGADTNTLTLSQNATTGARPAVVFNKVTDAPAPRHGESYVIAQADGGITGKFGPVYTFQGVLRPELSYSVDGKTVTATLRAGSLVEILDGGNATELAFASALDGLRNGFYNQLSGLYGNIDWMGGAQLSATFRAMSPAPILGETKLLQDRQSRQLLGNVSDRLSLLGTGRAQGFSFVGSSSALARTRDSQTASAQLGITTGNAATVAAPAGLSGFVAVGGDHVAASYGDNNRSGTGQRGRYFASGIEAPLGNAMIGSAIGFAEAETAAGDDQAKSKVTQAAGYASLPVGKSAYVGGIFAAERATSGTNRLTTDTSSMLRLSGATRSVRYMANAEAGMRMGIGRGLFVSPRAQLGFSHYSLGGFREQGSEAALTLDELKVNRVESRFGAKLDGSAMLGKWSVRPNLQADYVRLLSGADAGLKLAFAAAPEYSFALPLTNGGSGWMELKGGVELTRGKFSLGLSGQANMGDAPLSDQRGAVDLTFRF